MWFVPDKIQITIVEHVLLHGRTMREVGLQAHLHGYYWYIQYIYSTQQQYFRWENFHYSMYSNAHVVHPYCKLITVELICSQVVFTCPVFVQNWDECLGEAEVFFPED